MAFKILLECVLLKRISPSVGLIVLDFAGINALCGIGILSTAYAVKEGGWVSLSILLLYALFSFYTGLLLRYCLDSAPGLETYPDIGQAAFGTTGRIIISVSFKFFSSMVNFKALISL